MRVRSSRHKKLKKIAWTTAVLVGIVLVGLLLPRIFNFVGSVVMIPVASVSQWYSSSDSLIPAMMRDRQQLLEQVEQLENDLVVSRGSQILASRLRDENRRLRSLLGATEEERLVAGVIARPFELPYDVVQIDRGATAGITEGSLVYSGPDQLLGLVTYVTPTYSLVKLFTSPGSEITGFIAGSEVTVTVEGVGGGVSRVRVPQGIPLSIGDVVYVPGVGPGVFGQIDHIENRPSQPEQYGYITLETSLKSLHLVAVTKNPVTEITPEQIQQGRESILSERLLVEEAHTVSFEEETATSTGTSSQDI